MPVRIVRASSAAPVSNSSLARSWPTKVTQPSTRPPAGKRVDDGSLAIEHLGRRADERPFLDVPSPRADRASYPNSVHRLGDAIGVGDGTRLDHRRHPVLGALDGAQGGRQFIVVGRVLGMYGNGPLEDRRARREQVGDATAHQRIARQVLVGVDHAGCDDAIGCIDHGRIAGARRAAPWSSRPRR